MPSWNIHTAHVERLLAEERAEDLGIRDENVFLFGNLLPDVYVGYMVPNATKKIPYKDTHFASPDFIPTPDASLFYQSYILGNHDVSDAVLGAWCHLLCDHYYNLRTVEYIASIGVKPGETTRIRKQADFDLFGRTHTIERVPVVTSELLRAAAAFPQYRVDEPDVRDAVAVMEGIVENNRARHVSGTPDYSLLTVEFFSTTFAEVGNVLREALHVHVAHGDPTYLGRPKA